MLNYKRLMNTPAAGGGGFDPEANLVTPLTVAPQGTLDRFTHFDLGVSGVYAFTTPATYTTGAGKGGIIMNLGGFNGFVFSADENGKIAFYTTYGSGGPYIVVTDSPVLTPNARVVFESETDVKFRLWVNGVEPAVTELRTWAGAGRWTGGDVGGYLTGGTGFQNTATSEPIDALWTSLPGVYQAVSTTGWSDMTVYYNQLVT